MKTRTNPLDHVKVAAPCPAEWERMIGPEQVRFCAQCNLNVYNLSGMTRAEAEHLISQTEGRLCVRYYRRADGTILTKNCPVGLRALRLRLTRMAGAVASLVLSFFAGVFAVIGWEYTPPSSEYMQGEAIIMPEVERDAGNEVQGQILKPREEPMMGVMAVAPDYSQRSSRMRERGAR